MAFSARHTSSLNYNLQFIVFCMGIALAFVSLLILWIHPMLGPQGLNLEKLV